MHATIHTDDLTWRQWLTLTGLLAPLLGDATIIGAATWLAHQHEPIPPAPPATVTDIPADM